jgi:AraC-like DNA-binding protein
MAVTPTVCVKALRAPFFAAAARSRTPLSELAARVDVPLSLLSDLDARVPHATVVRVWDTFADHCEEPAFGLVAASFIGGGPLDLLDYALFCAPTLRELALRLRRYQSLFHDANDIVMEETEARLIVRHGFLPVEGREPPRSRHFIEFLAGMWAIRIRLATGKPLLKFAMTSRHAPPPDLALHRAMFGEDLTFDAEHDSLAIERALVDQPLVSSDPGGVAAFDAHLAAELDRRVEARFPDRVRLALVEHIKRGCFDIDAIARAIACSRRTLQRRLMESGSSFREVLDAARREVALEAIARGGQMTTVTDLTFLLGFSDLSGFSRAFRRWTGQSPGTYMRARQS